jgi:hypothetical protein
LDAFREAFDKVRIATRRLVRDRLYKTSTDF